jgi:hypothetical protein
VGLGVGGTGVGAGVGAGVGFGVGAGVGKQHVTSCDFEHPCDIAGVPSSSMARHSPAGCPGWWTRRNFAVSSMFPAALTAALHFT